MARMCAISLQSFANGCIECSGAFLFFAPGPVDLPALCAGSGIAQKRQKNRRRFGAEECFFSGGAADRRGGGQRSGPGQRRDKEAAKGGKKMGESGKKACTKWENRPKNGRRYKKKAGFPAFFVLFSV